jgi:hypothetical protein
MQWDWTKTAWKAIRGAGAAAVAYAVLLFLGAFDTEAEQLAAGVPAWAAPAGAVAVGFVISAVRNWITINRPEWNVVKAVGRTVRPALCGKARP